MLNTLSAFARLMRIDRPIGTLLLLWPTLWAIWIAGEGQPSARITLIFITGVFIMRSAGCVINDYADREFDKHVNRTKSRPLTTGEITEKQALALFAGLLVLALILVLQLNLLSFWYALAAVAIAALYPFSKRFTQLPQALLGLAFSFGIPMAFAAQQNQVPLIAWGLLLANFCWVVAYDTIYAMVDRPDDLNIGIKSTAILFGDNDRLIVAGLQCISVAILASIGVALSLGLPFWLFLAIAAGLIPHQYRETEGYDPQRTFAAFLNNNWFGMSVFTGILLHYLP